MSKTGTMKIYATCVLAAIIITGTISPLFAQSPYSLSWKKDGSLLSVGGALGATGFILYQSVSPPSPSEVNQCLRETVNGFDRSAIFHYSEQADRTSDVLFGMAAVAPFLLFADKAMQDDWKTITLMYIETWSFIGSTSMLSKGLVERYRPFVHNPNAPFDKKLSSDAKMSFFSNHTTTAFASAVFLSTVYSDYNPHSEWRSCVWAGSLLAASVVGYLRYEAGMHFPTDILVGALMGSAIGYSIPWMHRSEINNVSVLPGAQNSEYGFSLQIVF
jgi:hypothetical protein